jgi:hypothetical protein
VITQEAKKKRGKMYSPRSEDRAASNMKIAFGTHLIPSKRLFSPSDIKITGRALHFY